MAESEIVVSTEALEELQLSLKRFRNFLLEHLREVKAEMRRLKENLEEGRRVAALRVRDCQAAIDAADEDEDTTQYYEDLEAAEEDLHRIQRAQRMMDELATAYKREADDLLKIAESKLPSSGIFLEQKVEATRTLFAIQSEGVATGFIGAAIQMMVDLTGAGINAGTEIVGAALTVIGESLDPTNFSLPSGHRWLRLDEIDLEEALAEVNSAADFRPYASYDMMKAGLGTLKEKILPGIGSQGYAADSFYFQRMDLKSCVDYEHGAQRVFDAFFGNDAIAVQLEPNTGKFTVINGRHRIKAALDAGWLAVPVKTTR